MKKLSALLICLLMIITCGLAGCATFSIDKVKYYNEVLATVDKTKITRFDLLSAYNSYGNNYYVQQMGQSEEQALKSTLDLLIDRELLYQYALENNDLYRPTAYQVNEVVKNIFDSMDEQMESYVEKSKKILDIKIETKKDETEQEDETAYKLEDYSYSPRAVVKSRTNGQDVEYYIEYIVPEEETNYDELIESSYLTNFTSSKIAAEIKNKYFSHLLEELSATENENATILWTKARSLFAQDLTEYEYYLRDANGKKYNHVSEDLFNRYFERTFKNQIQSQYLENVRTHYLKTEELSIELLTEEYNYLATISYNTYSDFDSYKDKMKNIGTEGEKVLYHPTTDVQFGYFIHTLISFDSIKENLELLEEEKDPDKYELAYNNLIKNVTVKERDLQTGLQKEDAEAKTLSEIFDEYNNIKTIADYEERLSAFVQFMFKYTGDTATLNQGMPYVVGTKGYSAMVEEFNNEAIALMQGEKGNMSSASVSNIDDLCITEYGIHLLFYVDNVNSYDINYDDSSNVYIQNEDIAGLENFNLYTKTINPLTKKTYFDMMFDTVYPTSSNEEVYTSNNGYTKYEKSLTKSIQKSHKVTKFTSKIDATKVSI